jgi:hypothetical protein
MEVRETKAVRLRAASASTTVGDGRALRPESRRKILFRDKLPRMEIAVKRTYGSRASTLARFADAVRCRRVLRKQPLRNEDLRRGCARGTKLLRSRTQPTPRDENGKAYLPASDSRSIRRRRTSSYGINCTLPESMSSIRRLISFDQASSTPSSWGNASRLSSSESAIAARASGGRARAFFRIAEASSVTKSFYTVASSLISRLRRCIIRSRFCLTDRFHESQ